MVTATEEILSHRTFPHGNFPSLSIILHLTKSFHASINYDTLYTFQYASSYRLTMPTLSEHLWV